MGKLASGTTSVGSVPIRQEPVVKVSDIQATVAEKYQLVALERIRSVLGGLARQLEDTTRPVDEYQVNAVYSELESLSTLEVLPQFEISERIESIVATGPPATTFNLQLGDRYWDLVTDASGKVVIAPISMLLNRNDRRILTSTTAGDWTLELMGNADARY
jgi:hypothetical protein